MEMEKVEGSERSVCAGIPARSETARDFGAASGRAGSFGNADIVPVGTGRGPLASREFG